MSDTIEFDLDLIPQKGLWYEVFNFSERDYGSDWGYVLYQDGVEVERASGYSKIRVAGEAAQRAKKPREKARNNA